MLRAIAQGLGRLEEIIICLFLVGMTLLVFFEVIVRLMYAELIELFGEGSIDIFWIEELTLMGAAWFVLFGAAYGIKVGAHIGVDAFVRLLPLAARRVVGLVVVAAGLAYCGLFLAGGWVYESKMYKIGIEMEDLPIPRWVTFSMLMLGMVMIGWRLAEIGWRILTGKAGGFDLADEAREVLEDRVEMNQEAAR
ncbi:TRAP transporter small permease [Roseospirillum parvum]|uniref:TRAP transporter small permease protein n=1 Tax=Roseospirillum parvum TaxID=83401 RepID=A0A1G7UFP0_9PROT|nr:TRAP transporter small permease [Roseospirillum parvum]SDG46277.1 C4-dicarboxylate transporter, DctQ subunit [Roseospirillum parvum]